MKSTAYLSTTVTHFIRITIWPKKLLVSVRFIVEKRQKSYQYDQKDFLSAPNTFDLIAVKNVASGTKAPRKPLMETK